MKGLLLIFYYSFNFVFDWNYILQRENIINKMFYCETNKNEYLFKQGDSA